MKIVLNFIIKYVFFRFMRRQLKKKKKYKIENQNENKKINHMK